MSEFSLPDPSLHYASGAVSDPPLLPQILRFRAEYSPQQIYLTEINTDGAIRHMSYIELEERSAQLSAHLTRHYGVKPGCRVALIPTNSACSVVAIFALMRMGAVTLMLNPTDPSARQQELCDRAGTTLCLRDPTICSERVVESFIIPDCEDIDRYGYCDPVIDRWSDIFLIGTSGSTAASKIVRQMHAGAASNAADTIRHHRLATGQTLLGCLPINHVNGLHFTLLSTFAAGMQAVLLREFNPFSYLKVMTKVQPRIASVTPNLLDALAIVWRQEVVPKSFDYFVSAAAPLSKETARTVFDRIGARIVQSYGLTETTNFSCAMSTDLSGDVYQHLMFEMDIPPVGISISNEVAVLDEVGNHLPPGEIGEVSMRGPNVMAGYLDNPNATAEAFRDGWFRSGDLGYQISCDGQEPLTVLTGRIKNIAKVRGETVSLEEVDRVLRSVPGVTDGACVAIQDVFDGERIVIVIVASDDVNDDMVIQALAAVLPHAAMPQRIIRMTTLPRTATGKIRRPDLAREITALG